MQKARMEIWKGCNGKGEKKGVVEKEIDHHG